MRDHPRYSPPVPVGPAELAQLRTTLGPLTIETPEAAPAPALPAGAIVGRYRFRDLGRPWRTVSEAGIRAGTIAAVEIGAQDLTFDLAIDFAHRFREEADLAYARRDERAEEQWATWAEELEIWAAKRRPAPAIVVRRTAVHHDEQQPSFAEMTRR